MINIKELRIGNYVIIDQSRMWSSCKKVCCVTSITKDDGTIYNKYLINGHEESRVAPIPLTEDILLKCGFEKGINDDYDIIYDFDESGVYYCDQITITYNTFDCCIYILQQFSDENDEVHCNNSAKIARDIKYLHDLQNLFYDLTKTELNIQL